ncbi:MAG: hypothetical protein ACOC44_04390 [Promethearchaeia archaeon]
MKEQSSAEEIPVVYKKEKSTIILILDGLFDLSLGIGYFLFLRPLLEVLVQPLQDATIFSFNIMLFFDIVLTLELIMAVLELIAVYYIKFSDNEIVPMYIKRIFIISHVILIPLGGIINLIVDYILM